MELVHLQQQLPGLFQAALANLSSPVIAAAVDHYAAFTAYAHPGTADAAALEPSSMLPQLHAVKDSHLAQDTSSDTIQDIGIKDVSTVEASGLNVAATVDDGNGDGAGEIQWDIADESSTLSSAQQPDDLGDQDSGAAVGADIDWDVVAEATSEPASASQGQPAWTYCTSWHSGLKATSFAWYVHLDLGTGVAHQELWDVSCQIPVILNTLNRMLHITVFRGALRCPDDERMSLELSAQ